MENSSHRPMTPGEAREHRKQQAMKEYQERMRSLNKERQSILTNEVLWTGKADSQQERQQGNAAAEERARQRMALVQQLQQERAASEAMLEALRAVSFIIKATCLCDSCIMISSHRIFLEQALS